MKSPQNVESVYSGYGIGFDTLFKMLWLGDSWGKNLFIFAVAMSSSVHVDLKKKIYWRPNTRSRWYCNITETKYPINFTKSVKRFVFTMEATVSDLLMH